MQAPLKVQNQKNDNLRYILAAYGITIHHRSDVCFLQPVFSCVSRE